VTLELLKGAVVRGVDARTELVTPTGAAVLIAHDASFGPLPELALQATGVGGGSRVTERPNICRVLVGVKADAAMLGAGARLETCVVLETNIDDQTPEAIGYAVEAIIRAGALDAWVVPILMKKSRPAFALSVLVHPDDESRLLETVFRHTTTLGVRRRETTRWALERSEVLVRVRGHDIRVKVATLHDEVVNIAPEFQDCVHVAEQAGIPFKDVHDDALASARRAVGESN
jgi:hypothetical protein